LVAVFDAVFGGRFRSFLKYLKKAYCRNLAMVFAGLMLRFVVVVEQSEAADESNHQISA